MPNMFGGDQMDPDYAPHLYDDEGKRVSNPDSDQVRDKFEKETEAANKRRVPRAPPPVAGLPAVLPTDRRIRSVVGDYRAVVPDGIQKGRRFFVNNSVVVIEKRSKDASGAEKWDRVTSFSKTGSESGNEDADHAVYWLLAGPDAE